MIQQRCGFPLRQMLKSNLRPSRPCLHTNLIGRDQRPRAVCDSVAFIDAPVQYKVLSGY